MSRRAGRSACLSTSAAFVAFVVGLTAIVDGASANSIVVETAAVPLNALMPEQERIGRLRYLGGLRLTSDDRRFGGLSGLAFHPDGQRLIAVSDKGRWFSARLVEGADGVLRGLSDTSYSAMLDSTGRPLSGKDIDAEAVEVGPDGALYVSFERHHRIARYRLNDFMTARAEQAGYSIAFDGVPFNTGLESLTVLADGKVLALTEDARDENGRIRGWLLADGFEKPVRLDPTGTFKPTDLARLPDGDLLLLERRYSPLTGVAVRLSRIAGAAAAGDGPLSGKEVALLSPPLSVDNFEGLAVRAGPGGVVWIYIVSDNNFNALQRTYLFKFRLDD